MPRLAAAALLWALCARSGQASMTVIHLSPSDIEGARIEGLRRLPFEEGLLEGEGSLESPPIETSPFDRLVGSWNAKTPPDASVEMQAQVRSSGAWSKWFKLARWQEGSPASFGPQADDWGSMSVDVLALSRKADALRYRILLAGGRRERPVLRQVALTLDDSSLGMPPSRPFQPGPWVRELRVKGRSQMTEADTLKRDICSPTSLSMVLDFWKKRGSTEKTAQAVLDRAVAGAFGNWTLNTVYAGERGLSAEAAWLPSLEALQEEIASGRPAVVSVSFSEGELSGAPLPRTKGHLFVVSGFTAGGDVIAQDPAAPDASSTRRVYRRFEFENVWLRRKRGLCYRLGPRFPLELAVAAPVADLRLRRNASSATDPMDKGLGSQLLYGERVLALEARGDFVRVEALEQPKLAGGKRWTGYPGWVRAEALRKDLRSRASNCVVRAKRLELPRPDAPTLTLPLGSSLLCETAASPNGSVETLLLDGRRARVESAQLRSLPSAAAEETLRRDVLEAAALFLGDRYVWGGRSSVQKQAGWGVDCSGLVNLAYRSAGIGVPRDAQDQFLKARRIARQALHPGDPVFLTVSERSREVDHVLLYAGGEGLLESRASAGKTLRTTFQERFGVPLSSLEDGGAVKDLSEAPPRRRRIHFGAFF